MDFDELSDEAKGKLAWQLADWFGDKGRVAAMIVEEAKPDDKEPDDLNEMIAWLQDLADGKEI